MFPDIVVSGRTGLITYGSGSEPLAAAAGDLPGGGSGVVGGDGIAGTTKGRNWRKEGEQEREQHG